MIPQPIIQASHDLPVLDAQIVETVPVHSTLNTRHSTLCSPPRASVSTRPATLADLPAIDALQKKHSRQLGFFPRAQMEGYIRNGWVLVAETVSDQCSVISGQNHAPGLTTDHSPLTTPLAGYLASRDRYLKRDELGVVYQLCVSEDARRKFVAATLLKAVFDRASYGCRLFCCWCAQDLAANRFWESMGFVPLAFRSGSRKKDRVHIFWQKRIRAGDDGDANRGGTPWWFPSQTGGGSIREDRIVLPIPPGVRWSDEMPRVYPGKSEERRELREESGGSGAGVRGSANQGIPPEPRTLNPEPTSPTSREEARLTVRTGLHFGGGKAKPVKVKKPAPKFEAEQIAMSRQLRDRWLENVNADPTALLPTGRYDLVREIGVVPPVEIALLPAPMAA